MSNVLLVLKETLWPLTPSLRAASPKLASCLTTSSFILSVFSLCTPPSPWYPALPSWQTNSQSCKAELLSNHLLILCVPSLSSQSQFLSLPSSWPHPPTPSWLHALLSSVVILGQAAESERTKAAQSCSYHASREIQIWVIFSRVLDRSLLKAERNLTVFSLSFSWANTNQNLFWVSSWLSLKWQSHPWPHTHRLPCFEFCF